MQRCGEAEDPPDCESVRAFACTFPDALPLLQEELQPISARIGQVAPYPLALPAGRLPPCTVRASVHKHIRVSVALLSA